MLTQKQENFCLAYIETGNASEAYRRSFSAGKMKPETVTKRASELLSNGDITGRLGELRKQENTVNADVMHSASTSETQAEKSRERLYAEILLSPIACNSSTAHRFGNNVFPNVDPLEMVHAMKGVVEKAVGGDMSNAEALLMAQALNLDKIFNEMARRAALNMGEHLGAMETYMRLALKAQTQCRTTLQTLSDIKNPRTVAFVKQANISNGPQQVNNGALPRTENLVNQSNELSGSSHELLPDARASQITVGVNQKMETVGEIYRAENN